MDAWRSGADRDRLTALGQVSRSVSVTCAVSDKWSADSPQSFSMNGGYPLGPVAPARTRPVAGIIAQPGRCKRPRPGLLSMAVAGLRPAGLPLAAVST